MPDYRACVLGADGQFVSVHEFDAPDRGEATKTAIGYVDGRPVELWEGELCFGVFKPSTDALAHFKQLRDSQPKQ